MNANPGTLLRGRYLLVELIASGGMGEVWKADDQLLGRQVAVKILKREYAEDESFRMRFRAEARHTASLSHPGIAQVYDYGEQDDLAYLVMELLPGQPLSAILARRERLSTDVTLEIISQSSRALQVAHDEGIIHRDIKPGNLIINPDGQVKLTDFGIARAMNAATLTQTGTVLGTAQYVSPEQAEGRPLTPSTDIYSLGVVAYECLAGQLPFTGDTPVAIALAHVREQPPPLPDDVPAPVSQLIERMLDKNAARRPASAGELANLAYLLRESLAMGGTGMGLSVAQLGAAGAEVPPARTLPAGDAAEAALEEGDKATAPQQAILPADVPPGATDRRRLALVTASVVALVVVFAGALLLGFRWDSLFHTARFAGDNGPSPQHSDQRTGGVIVPGIGPSGSSTPGYTPPDPAGDPTDAGTGPGDTGDAEPSKESSTPPKTTSEPTQPETTPPTQPETPPPTSEPTTQPETTPPTSPEPPPPDESDPPGGTSGGTGSGTGGGADGGTNGGTGNGPSDEA